MSDGSLSQDEIDALLQGTGGMEFDSGPVTEALTDPQRQRFLSLVRSTVGSQQANLSILVSSSVTINPPELDLVDSSEFAGQLPDPVLQISLDFTEGAPGHHSYVMGDDAAVGIAGPMMGLDGVELDAAAVNALQEAFSQISAPVITALGDQIGRTVMNNPPSGEICGPGEVSLPPGQLVRLRYAVKIGDAPPVEVHELFEPSVVLAALGQSAASSGGGRGARAGGFGGAGSAPGASPVGQGYGGGASYSGFGGSPNVQSVQFPNLTPAGGGGEQGNIGLLMDVFMEMTVELGRTRKLIKEILGMGEGTIIELDKLAGEPVDILVNHKLIAKGEVVVIDENFGVRVTEIVSPLERMGNNMP